MARLVKPDGKKITDLCNHKGWGELELSQHADISLATARKVMKGQECFRKSLSLVANALGKEFWQLIDGVPPLRRIKEDRYNVYLVFENASLGEFDDRRILSIIDSITKTINASDDIEMEDIEEGSVILGLSFNWNDLTSLQAYLHQNPNDLHDLLGVDEIVILSHLGRDSYKKATDTKTNQTDEESTSKKKKKRKRKPEEE